MGGGVYAHRCTHGGPPRPHLIVQCITPIKTLLIGLALLQAKFSPDTSPGNRPEAHSVFTRTDEAKAKSNRFLHSCKLISSLLG